MLGTQSSTGSCDQDGLDWFNQKLKRMWSGRRALVLSGIAVVHIKSACDFRRKIQTADVLCVDPSG